MKIEDKIILKGEILKKFFLKNNRKVEKPIKELF